MYTVVTTTSNLGSANSANSSSIITFTVDSPGWIGGGTTTNYAAFYNDIFYSLFESSQSAIYNAFNSFDNGHNADTTAGTQSIFVLSILYTTITSNSTINRTLDILSIFETFEETGMQPGDAGTFRTTFVKSRGERTVFQSFDRIGMDVMPLVGNTATEFNTFITISNFSNYKSNTDDYFPGGWLLPHGTTTTSDFANSIITQSGTFTIFPNAARITTITTSTIRNLIVSTTRTTNRSVIFGTITNEDQNTTFISFETITALTTTLLIGNWTTVTYVSSNLYGPTISVLLPETSEMLLMPTASVDGVSPISNKLLTTESIVDAPRASYEYIYSDFFSNTFISLTYYTTISSSVTLITTNNSVFSSVYNSIRSSIETVISNNSSTTSKNYRTSPVTFFQISIETMTNSFFLFTSISSFRTLSVDTINPNYVGTKNKIVIYAYSYIDNVSVFVHDSNLELALTTINTIRSTVETFMIETTHNSILRAIPPATNIGPGIWEITESFGYLAGTFFGKTLVTYGNTATITYFDIDYLSIETFINNGITAILPYGGYKINTKAKETDERFLNFTHVENNLPVSTFVADMLANQIQSASSDISSEVYAIGDNSFITANTMKSETTYFISFGGILHTKSKHELLNLSNGYWEITFSDSSSNTYGSTITEMFFEKDIANSIVVIDSNRIVKNLIPKNSNLTYDSSILTTSFLRNLYQTSFIT